MSGGANTLIGGATAAARNVISGNRGDGVLVNESAAGTVIQGNSIGTDGSGTAALGNANGVLVGPTASNTRAGGTAAGEGNVIAFNRLAGVAVQGTASRVTFPRGVRVLGNSIHSNGGQGIDLAAGNFADGVTANDLGDADDGTNGLQNHPVLTGVVGTSVFGRLHSNPNGTFRIEFFADTARHPSGFGQGRTLIGVREVTTDAVGNAAIDTTSPTDLTGRFVTATATNVSSFLTETSEFSNAVLGLASPPSCRRSRHRSPRRTPNRRSPRTR